MRLHSMTLQAIGPFAGRHTVDFAALSASGIFLLEGPTGAGKSTIIDAVVFALYGKVASEAASEDRLRSAYASDSTDSFVDLVFETGSGVFRVLRSPARMRPKKTGTGTTKQQATVKLWRLSAGALDGPPGEPGDVGELMSTRLDETGLEIQRAVGLDRTQFVQTIVLPQGEFATFLKAEPENRKGLLQKVFGTEVYDRAQAELASLRKGANELVAGAETRVAGALDLFVGVADLDEDDAAALREAPVEHVAKLAAEHATEMAHRAETSGAHHAAAQGRLLTAREALDHARAALSSATRRERLRAEQGELTAQAAGVAESTALLGAARRAALVVPTIRAVQTARTAVERACGELEATFPEEAEAWPAALMLRDTARRLTRSAEGASPAHEADRAAEADTARAELRARRDSDSAQSAVLGRLVEIETRLPARREAYVAAVGEAEALQAEVAAAALALADRPQERTVLEIVRDGLRSRAGALPALSETAARARSLVEACARLMVLDRDLAEARQVLLRAGEVASRAAALEAGLRQAWIEGIAGEVAGRLVEGEPCPVCGACEHPAPAGRGLGHVDRPTVDAAEDARREADTVLAAAGQDAVAAEERLRAQEALVGGITAEEAEKAWELAAAAVTEAARAEQEAVAAAEAVLAFDEATRRLMDVHSARTDGLTRERARLEHEAEAIDEDTREVELGLTTSGSAEATIKAAVGALSRQVVAADVLLVAHAGVVSALTTHEQRRLDRSEALRTSGFSAVSEVEAAVLADDEIEARSELVAQHRSACERVALGLADPAVRDLPEVVDVDLELAERVAEEAQAHAQRTSAESALAGDRLGKVRAAADMIASAVASLDEVLTSASPVIRMANLAAGTSADNMKSLTLGTFVLVRRFEEVVAAANTRLSTMSDGRFELMSSDEREDVRSRRTGLAMKVIDHRTETARDPRTLSGGETFYVSLCLALGMADVVTAEAGGIDLGTLFVDEGFGSLDPETLDSVLQVLGTLHTGGRVVGVVSHVEALKQSISDGISVRRLADGSSTLTVRAG